MHRRRSSDTNEDSALSSQQLVQNDYEPYDDPDTNNERGNEHSSLLSSPSVEDIEATKRVEPDRNHESPHLDVRGFALLPHLEFWQLFCMMGLMTGIGLMTIK